MYSVTSIINVSFAIGNDLWFSICYVKNVSLAPQVEVFDTAAKCPPEACPHQNNLSQPKWKGFKPTHALHQKPQASTYTNKEPAKKFLKDSWHKKNYLQGIQTQDVLFHYAFQKVRHMLRYFVLFDKKQAIALLATLLLNLKLSVLQRNHYQQLAVFHSQKPSRRFERKLQI